MKCPKCGAEVLEGDKFCGACGKILTPEKKELSNRTHQMIIIAIIIAMAIGFILYAYLTDKPQLIVSEASLLPSLLDRSAIMLEEGTDSLFKFSISNEGGRTLTWGISDDQPWIDINPTSGVDYGDVAVNINATGLDVGSYYGNITISSNGGTKTKEINLTVLPRIRPPTPPKSRTLIAGETWDMDRGYSLTIKSIDATAKPRQVWLILSRNGNMLDDKLLAEGETYNWNNIFRTLIAEIYTQDMSDRVTLTNTTIS